MPRIQMNKFKVPNHNFLLISIAVTSLLVLAGIPRSRLEYKDFLKNLPEFPAKIEKIQTADTDDTLKVILDIPEGYSDYQLFFGNELENLQRKLKAANEFVKFKGIVDLKKSSAQLKVFSRNDKSELQLSKTGELYYLSAKSKKLQRLASFGSKYFEDTSLIKALSKKVQNLTYVSSDKQKLTIDFLALEAVELDSKHFTVVFYKHDNASSKKQFTEPFSIATEVTLPADAIAARRLLKPPTLRTSSSSNSTGTLTHSASNTSASSSNSSSTSTSNNSSSSASSLSSLLSAISSILRPTTTTTTSSTTTTTIAKKVCTVFGTCEVSTGGGSLGLGSGRSCAGNNDCSHLHCPEGGTCHLIFEPGFDECTLNDACPGGEQIASAQVGATDLVDTGLASLDFSTLSKALLGANGRSIGSPNAPVKIEVFHDLKCSMCKVWFLSTLPKLLSNYVEKGLLELTFIDFPLVPVESQITYAKASLCAEDQDKYFEYTNKLYSSFKTREETKIDDYAAELGLNVVKFKECMQSREKFKDINSNITLGKVYGVDATPVFVVNGKELFKGARSFEQFKLLIEKNLGSSQK